MTRLRSSLITCLALCACAQAAAAQTAPRKIDEYGNICCDDEKARLDNFAFELQNDPGARAYIIYYGGGGVTTPTATASAWGCRSEVMRPRGSEC